MTARSVCGLVLLASIVASVMLGSTWIGPSEIIDALRGSPRTRAHDIAVWDVRLPRTIIAIGAGAMLSAAGAMLQMLVRNALGSPDLTGVTAGGLLGAVVTVTIGFGPVAVAIAAIAGALVASAAVMAIGWSSLSTDPRRLAVIGVVVSAVVGATTSLTLVAGGGNPDTIVRWLIGTLESRSWADAQRLGVGLLIATPITAVAVPACNLSALGPTNATALGARTRTLAALILAASCALAGSAVAAVGAVAFIGLVAPHIARSTSGGDSRRLVPDSALVGATLLLVADIVSRTFTIGWIPGLTDTALGARRLPVGVFTAMIGGVFFIRIARRA
jgi:iron complex transport system permease protein